MSDHVKRSGQEVHVLASDKSNSPSSYEHLQRFSECYLIVTLEILVIFIKMLSPRNMVIIFATRTGFRASSNCTECSEQETVHWLQMGVYYATTSLKVGNSFRCQSLGP